MPQGLGEDPEQILREMHLEIEDYIGDCDRRLAKLWDLHRRTEALLQAYGDRSGTQNIHAMTRAVLKDVRDLL